MKAFTKILALLMTLIMLVFCFSACKKDKKDPEPEPESSDASSEPQVDDGDDEEPTDDEEPEDDDDDGDDDDDWDDDEPDEPTDDDEPDEPSLEEIATKHIKARIATPSKGMKATDRITYMLSPLDLGADRTGKEDCTDIIQACLSAAHAAGGGVVYLPAGFYRVEKNELTIEGGVTLRGEWMNPDEGGLGAANKGTVLMAYDKRGSANDSMDSPLISMKSAATLRDISVWYPEQSATNPQAYPSTIRGTGHTVVMKGFGIYCRRCKAA